MYIERLRFSAGEMRLTQFSFAAAVGTAFGFSERKRVSFRRMKKRTPRYLKKFLGLHRLRFLPTSRFSHSFFWPRAIRLLAFNFLCRFFFLHRFLSILLSLSPPSSALAVGTAETTFQRKLSGFQPARTPAMPPARGSLGAARERVYGLDSEANEFAVTCVTFFSFYCFCFYCSTHSLSRRERKLSDGTPFS